MEQKHLRWRSSRALGAPRPRAPARLAPAAQRWRAPLGAMVAKKDEVSIGRARAVLLVSQGKLWEAPEHFRKRCRRCGAARGGGLPGAAASGGDAAAPTKAARGVAKLRQCSSQPLAGPKWLIGAARACCGSLGAARARLPASLP